MGWFQTLKSMLDNDESAGMTELDCPACSDSRFRNARLRETQLGQFGKVILDICPQCSGVWIEKGELDRLDDSPWANVEEHRFHEVDGDHEAAECPKCTVPLTPLSPADLPEVIVDKCPNCDGFWLDHGELDRMKEVAKKLDSDPGILVGDTKPAGWSDLRWRIHQLQATRD